MIIVDLVGRRPEPGTVWRPRGCRREPGVRPAAGAV